MRVFVSGATGVIGSRAVVRLLAAGHDVTGVCRSDEKAALLRGVGARAARIDPFDRDAMTAAAAGHEVLVNLATHIPPSRKAAKASAWNENDRVRNELSANIAAAARLHGATRLIQESIVLPYEDSGSDWVTEETPRRAPARLQSAERAETNARSAAGDGDPAKSGTAPVILRFGLFYAPDSVHTREQVELARKGMAPVVGGAKGYISSIHADDAADAVVAALAAPAGAYNVVEDEPVTRRVFAETIAHAVDREKSSFLLSMMFGLAGEARTGGIARSLRVSNELFKDATGWSPAHESVTTGLPPAVELILKSSNASA